MHYVYLLRLDDGEIYTGRSDDLRQRLSQHQNGNVSSTKKRRPVILIYYEAYQQKKDAIARETYLKTGDGRKQVRKQLQYSLQLSK